MPLRQAIADWIAFSDERDQQLRQRLAAFCEGWDACLDYWADAIGGSMFPARPTEIEVKRWGPGGREHFGDPRPGDYPGRDAA